MVHFVNRVEVWRGEIVVAAVHLHLELRILLHRRGEIRYCIDRMRQFLAGAGWTMQIVPAAVDVCIGLVGHFLAELERISHVIVECRDIRRRDGGGQRVVFRFLAHRIEGRAREARVEMPGGGLAAEQILGELPGVDAQIGALEVVGRDSGIRMQLGRDGGFSLGTQRRARRQGLRVIGQGEILNLAQQRRERVGLMGQVAVIPRGGRVGRQGKHVRQVRARVELRSVRIEVVVQ